MKNLLILLILLIINLGVFVVGVHYGTSIEYTHVDLPEEFPLITVDTPIQGYIKNDTLFIEFKH